MAQLTSCRSLVWTAWFVFPLARNLLCWLAVGNRTQLPAVELCGSLIAEVQQFSATQEFNDDVCLVAMDIDSRQPWKMTLPDEAS